MNRPLRYEKGGVAMNGTEIRPSRWYYGLAGFIGAVGAVIVIFNVVTSIRSIEQSGTQIVVPGKKDISISEPGKYTVYHEHISTVGGIHYASEGKVTGLRCEMAEKITGRAAKMYRTPASERYSIGDREGISMFKADIERPGTYEFSCAYEAGQGGPEIVLAMWQGLMDKIFRLVIGSLIILFLCEGACTAIIVVTAVKRDKAKARLKTQGTRAFSGAARIR
jgi:hypothetical protein